MKLELMRDCADCGGYGDSACSTCQGAGRIITADGKQLLEIIQQHWKPCK